MGALNRLERGLAPFGQPVARALVEVKARYRRIAHKLVHREFQRLLHHAVDHEAMRPRIDIRRARVMALEDEAVRRNDAGLVLQWRHAPVGKILAVLQHIAAPALHMRLVLRRLAVARLFDDAAGLLIARRDRQRRGARRACGAKSAARERRRATKKIPAIAFRHVSSSVCRSEYAPPNSAHATLICGVSCGNIVRRTRRT